MENSGCTRSGALYLELPSNAEYTPPSTSLLSYLGLWVSNTVVIDEIFDRTTMCLPRLSAV